MLDSSLRERADTRFSGHDRGTNRKRKVRVHCGIYQYAYIDREMNGNMNDLSEFVTLSDTTLTTDSRRVAKHFKKRHDNVLQAYDRIECSTEFSRLNFQVANSPSVLDKSKAVSLQYRLNQQTGVEHGQ